MGKKPFTIADGLEMQAEHLEAWGKRLKPEVFVELCSKTAEATVKALNDGAE